MPPLPSVGPKHLHHLGSPAPGQSLQKWIYTSLRTAIVAARLRAGCRLPGSRSLALEYGVARGTVKAAYDQLLSEGYLTARRGSGTRVAGAPPDALLHITKRQRYRKQKPALEPKFTSRPGTWFSRIEDSEAAFPLTQGKPPIPFLGHRCDVSAFPIDLWRRLHVRHLRPSRQSVLWDAPASGVLELRRAIAEHLQLARGVSVAPDQIVVVGSVQQALDLCLRLTVAPGERVWMEDPGYVGARQLIQAAGARVVDLPVDRDGMRIEIGIHRARNARLAYVTPSRQAPLGVTMSLARRAALLHWAEANNAYIFEDDYDSEYRFVGRPIPAMKSLPGGELRVILAGTFSKLLFSALRLAYVALPVHLVHPFTRAMSLTARYAPGLPQAVLADFMLEGHFDRHIRRMRRIYAARAEAFQSAAKRHWAGLLEVPPIQAGLDVVVRLVSVDEASATRLLERSGIAATPLGWYYRRHRSPGGFVMGFASFNETRIESAAQAVAAQFVSRHSPK